MTVPAPEVIIMARARSVSAAPQPHHNPNPNKKPLDAHGALAREDHCRLRATYTPSAPARGAHHDAIPATIPVTMFAREDVPTEAAGLAQVQALLGVQDTAAETWRAQQTGRTRAPMWGDAPGSIERVVLTPDFHKGATIPVGTVLRTRGMVLPQAVGGDIGCGMRLIVTSIDREAIIGREAALMRRLREVFFGGQRDLPLSPRQREALLRDGLIGLRETCADNAGVGLWRWYDPDAQEAALAHTHGHGRLHTQDVLSVFEDYVQSSGRHDGRDAQIGSVGGGNHFVEIQAIDALTDGPLAWSWGLRPGKLAIMVHSGSAGFGGLVGRVFEEAARALHPPELRHPAHGFWALPTEGPHAALAARYLSAMGNAANFAFGNRLFLGLMAVRALEETLGQPAHAHHVHDVPHNLLWPDGPNTFIHRKGACPAPGPSLDPQDPYAYTGAPVIIPGSMGAPSYLLTGLGNHDALTSACHGAGRALSRNAARATANTTPDPNTNPNTNPLHIITPIDPNAPHIRSRPDILAAYHQRVTEERPDAYKPITPIINTITDAHIATPVARLAPLMTVKG